MRRAPPAASALPPRGARHGQPTPATDWGVTRFGAWISALNWCVTARSNIQVIENKQ
ncbi:hypothetical protein PSEUDO8AS_40607 [Pseudomonas sp. 8AS]|nr:hypothetical protein PSEUDO8AS_40607 [Pseudomonas sp. 8AS]